MKINLTYVNLKKLKNVGDRKDLDFYGRRIKPHIKWQY